jgi:hypothetical protein
MMGEACREKLVDGRKLTCHVGTRYIASVQRAADKVPDNVPLLYYLDMMGRSIGKRPEPALFSIIADGGTARKTRQIPSF